MGSSASSSKPKEEKARQKNKFYESQLKTPYEDGENSNDKVKCANSSGDTTTATEQESCSSDRSSFSVCRNSKANNANTKNHKPEVQSHKFNVRRQSQTDTHTEGSTKLSDETTNEVKNKTDIKRDNEPENAKELRGVMKSDTTQPETSGSLDDVQEDTINDLTTCDFDRQDKHTESYRGNVLTPKQKGKASSLTPIDSINTEDSERNAPTVKQTDKAKNLIQTDSIIIEGPGHSQQQFETKTIERQERLLDPNKFKKRKDKGKQKPNEDMKQKLETGQSTTKTDHCVYGEAQDQESNCLSFFSPNPESEGAAEKSINTGKIVSTTDSNHFDDTLTDDVLASRSVEEQTSSVSGFEVPKSKSVNEITYVQTSWSPTRSEDQGQVDGTRSKKEMKNRNSVVDSKKTVNENDGIVKQDDDSKITGNDSDMFEEISTRMPAGTKNPIDDSILDQHKTEKDSEFHSKDNTDESKLNEEEYPENPKLTANKQLRDHQVTDSLEQKTDKDEEEKLNANLDFYRNEIKSRPPPGHTIEQMLGWYGNFKELESNHRYIQWLFPMFENSGMNPGAQALQIHEAEAIKEDPVLQGRVLRAIKMMLHFYGMEMVSDTDNPVKFSRARKIWKERYEHLNRSTHNHLRITRILRSIGYLGYKHLQYPWFEFILKESHAKDTLLPRLQGDCVKYWIESFEQQGDHLKAVELWTKLDSETKRPSRTK